MWLILAKVVIGVICLVVSLNLLTRRRVFKGKLLASSGVVVGLDVINEETHAVEVKFTTRYGENRVVKVLTEGMNAGEWLLIDLRVSLDARRQYDGKVLLDF